MPDVQEVVLEDLSWNELRAMAKDRGVASAGLKREEVEEALEAALITDSINDPEEPKRPEPPAVVPADEPVAEFHPVDAEDQHRLWEILSGLQPGIAVVQLWDYRKQQERLDLSIETKQGNGHVEFVFRPPYARFYTDEKGRESDGFCRVLKKLGIEYCRGRLTLPDLSDEVAKLEGVELR